MNAFYVREFQMIHAAEDAILASASGRPATFAPSAEWPRGRRWKNDRWQRRAQKAIDDFYARVIEHAVAYFGSRVLYPSRPAPDDMSPCSRVACGSSAGIRAEVSNESAAQDLGYRIGSQIYDAYLAGNSRAQRPAPPIPGSPRRARLGSKGLHCAIAKLRPASRSMARTAHT